MSDDMSDDTDRTEHMLTTIDNPFDPFTQWNQWLAYDTNMGYNTPAFLARIVVTSNEISESDQALAIENGIDEIVRENVTGMYRKVSKKVSTNS